MGIIFSIKTEYTNQALLFAIAPKHNNIWALRGKSPLGGK